MTKLEQITEWYTDEEFLSADGFNEAIIGINDNKIVYSITKCIIILMKRDNMDELEAQEYFDFNVSCAYMSKKHQFGLMILCLSKKHQYIGTNLTKRGVIDSLLFHLEMVQYLLLFEQQQFFSNNEVFILK